MNSRQPMSDCARLSVGLMLAASALTASAATVQPQTRGYVIDYFTYTTYFDGDDFSKDCPKGWFPDLSEAYLKTLPPAEQARLQKPENAKEYAARFRGEGTEGQYGEDICANPQSFAHDARYPASLDYSYRGALAKGLNLSGDPHRADAPKTCKHEQFTSPEGKPVDNQLFRAMGCARDWRGGDPQGGEQIDLERRYVNSGDNVYLLEISGITDMKNDDVVVRFYNTDDHPRVALNGKFMANETFRPRTEPRFTTVMHGKIINGVLKTDPVDVLRTNNKRPSTGANGVGPAFERLFRDARFELTFNADGSLKGLLGAYQKPFQNFQGRYDGKVSATVVGEVCPLEYASLAAYADGYPDPKTGACTQISTAYDVEAVPAFIQHADSEHATASVGSIGR